MHGFLFCLKIKTMLRIVFASLFGLCFLLPLEAQQKLTFQQSESLMVQNNTALIAAELNVSASRAMEIQAAIRPLPELYMEVNAYNPNRPQWFDMGQSGQKQASIQKLMQLGGKRKAEIDWAKSNTKLAELELESLFRKMRTSLAEAFYDNWYQIRKLEMLEKQAFVLDTLLINYQIQAQKGNIALKELVRLQALLSQVRSEYSSARLLLEESGKQLALLTGLDTIPIPQVNKNQLDTLLWREPVLRVDELIQIALAGNPELRLAQESSLNAERYLAWQKAMGITDITLGAGYDQRGGAFNNQLNLTLGMPLRLYNPNKGAIGAAKVELEKARIQQIQAKRELSLSVKNAFSKLKLNQDELRRIRLVNSSQLQQVYEGVMLNFHKRNISLLEFTDFIESYNQTLIRRQELEHSLLVSGFYLQELTAYDVFK